MRIHDIEIQNFRSLEHFRLTDIPGNGVIVISGDNEAGKSSVVEALQLLQNPKVKFDSNTTQLKSIKTLGKDEPIVISMRATLGPVTFRIRKQYRKKTSALLTIESPRHKEYTGREAEDQFRTLLTEHLDSSLADALLVPQGEVNPVIKAAGIPTLGAALEEIDGGEASGDDTELMKAVEDRYLTFFTPKGKPRGDLARLEQELEAADDERVEAEAEVERLESNVAHIERETKRLDKAQQEIPQAQKNLEVRRANFEAALQQQGELDKVTATKTAAELELTAAKAAQEQRTKLLADLDATTQHKATLADELEILRAESNAHSDRVATATEREQKAAKQVTAVRERLVVARRNLEHAQAAATLAELRLVLEDLDARTETLKKLRSSLPTSPLEATKVAALESAELAVKIAEAKAEAHAATVTFSATKPTEIDINGETIALGEHSLSLTEKTGIRIGAVTATFTPAKGGEDDRAELTKARGELEKLLSETGCNNAAHARETYEAEQKIARAIEAAERERTAALAGKDESALRETAENFARLLGESPDTPEDVQTATHSVEQLEAELLEAERELDKARSALVAEQKNSNEVELRVHEAQLDNVNETIARLQEQLEQEVETTEELEQAVDKATQRLQAVEADIARLREEMPDLDMVKALRDSAEERLTELQESVHAAEKDIELRRGEINLAEGAAERLIKAREAAEAAQFRYDQVLTQAKGAQLLRDTLLRHRDAARARYAQPFAEKLTSLARVLYGPEVTFELTDQLDIDQRVLGEQAVSLADLSGGAKEQLGILTRFAVAELVSEAGDAPIFLDDALGYSDTERLARMNYLLGRMGKDHQVFVLTCMPERYADIVGKRSFEMTELKAGE